MKLTRFAEYRRNLATNSQIIKNLENHGGRCPQAAAHIRQAHPPYTLIYKDSGYPRNAVIVSATACPHGPHMTQLHLSTHGSRRRIAGFAGLYITTLLINSLTNSLMLDILGRQQKTDIAGAFMIATGLTALVNFTMMKPLIFRPSRPHPDILQ